MHKKILQIIPAPDWLRVRIGPKDDHPTYARAVCLALVEDEDGTQVVPLIDDDCGPNWDGHPTALDGDKDCPIMVVEKRVPPGLKKYK